MIRPESARLIVQFSVAGQPQTAGSKRAFVNKQSGKAIVTDDNKKGKPWRADVQAAANQAIELTELLDGPLILETCFYFLRPQSHYGSGKNAKKLKASAPPWPKTRPDTTKLLRAMEDALTGVLWRDDSQIVFQVAAKKYSEFPGATVAVYSLPDRIEADPV